MLCCVAPTELLLTEAVLHTLKLTLRVAVSRVVEETETAGIDTIFVAILRYTRGMECHSSNIVT